MLLLLVLYQGIPLSQRKADATMTARLHFCHLEAGRGKAERHASAIPQLAGDFNLSAVKHGGALHARQPQTSAP